MYIEVIKHDSGVESRPITTKKGESKTLYHQRAWLWLPNEPYPVKLRVPLSSPAEAYQPGFYELSPSAYRVNNYGDLEIDRYNFAMLPTDAPPERAEA